MLMIGWGWEGNWRYCWGCQLSEIWSISWITILNCQDWLWKAKIWRAISEDWILAAKDLMVIHYEQVVCQWQLVFLIQREMTMLTKMITPRWDLTKYLFTSCYSCLRRRAEQQRRCLPSWSCLSREEEKSAFLLSGCASLTFTFMSDWSQYHIIFTALTPNPGPIGAKGRLRAGLSLPSRKNQHLKFGKISRQPTLCSRSTTYLPSHGICMN